MILIKKDLLCALGSLRSKKNKKASLGVSIAIFIATALFVTAYASFIAFNITFSGFIMGSPLNGPFMITLMSLILTATTSLMRATVQSKTNDSDLLLSLPIKRITIVTSKIFLQYIYDLIPVLIMFLPMSITYGILANESPLIYFRTAIIILMLPMLGTGLSQLFGYLMRKISEKTKYANLTNIIISFLGFIIVMIVSFMFGYSSSGSSLININDTFIPVISNILNFFIYCDIWGFLVLIAVTVLPFALGIKVYASTFGVAVKAYRDTSAKITYKSQGQKSALIKTELRRYFSTGIYIFNTSFGALLAVIFSIVTALKLGPVEELLTVFKMLGISPALIYCLIFSFCFTISPTTACTISLEGKQLWILSCAPVKTFDIYLSKLAVNIAVFLPGAIISSIIVLISPGLTFAEFAVMLLCEVSCILFASYTGLVINILNPKFDWDSEAVVVKQSASVFITMLIGMSLTAVPAIVYFTLLIGKFDSVIFIAVWSLILLAITALEHIYLSRKSLSAN